MSKELEKFKRVNNCETIPHVDMIINDMYAKGLLEADEYGIDIDW